MLKLHSNAKSAIKQQQDVKRALDSVIDEIYEKFNIKIQVTKLDQPFVYSLELPKPQPRPKYIPYGKQFEDVLKLKAKLSLSGGILMAKTGGGFKHFTDWLAEKKVI